MSEHLQPSWMQSHLMRVNQEPHLCLIICCTSNEACHWFLLQPGKKVLLCYLCEQITPISGVYSHELQSAILTTGTLQLLANSDANTLVEPPWCYTANWRRCSFGQINQKGGRVTSATVSQAFILNWELHTLICHGAPLHSAALLWNLFGRHTGMLLFIYCSLLFKCFLNLPNSDLFSQRNRG